MNFETWWEKYTSEIEAYFVAPYTKCQFEIVRLVKHLSKTVWENGRRQGYIEGYKAAIKFDFPKP